MHPQVPKLGQVEQPDEEMCGCGGGWMCLRSELGGSSETLRARDEVHVHLSSHPYGFVRAHVPTRWKAASCVLTND